MTLGKWTPCDYDTECGANRGCRNGGCTDCVGEGEECAWSNRAAPICCRKGLKCVKESFGGVGFCRWDRHHGGDSACTPDNKCGHTEGDCDKDDDCKDGLKCGTDNCGMQRR